MPNKKKNKKQITGLSMFIQDIKPELQRQGHNNKRMDELVQIAHPLWKNLSADEREMYNDQAKEAKRKMRDAGGVLSGGRLDCVGNLMSETIDLDEIDRRNERMQRCVSEFWPEGEGVCLEIFYIITFEVLCKFPDNQGYLPAEVAIIEYSLSAGIIRIFHRFIDPGPIPMGFRFLCLSTSDDKHQIPIENFDRAERDYRELWADMCNFINPDKRKSLPCLYTLKENCDKVAFCVDWMARHADVPNKLDEKIYQLEILYTELHYHGVRGDKPSLTCATIMFSSTSFDYESNTRCDFHEELENKHCALAVAKIHCYILSDSLATIYDFELTASHCPVRSDRSYYTYTTPSSYKPPPLRQNQMPVNRQNGYGDLSEKLSAGSAFASRDIRYNKPELQEEQPLRRPKGRGIAGSIGVTVPGRSLSQTSFTDTASEPASEPDLEGMPRLDYAGWNPGSKPYQQDVNISASNADEWPSLGGPPAAFEKQCAMPKKYANGKVAPPPSAVPQPAPSWQTAGRGRGLVAVTGVPPKTTQQFPSLNRNMAEVKTKQIQEYFRGTGRGRGVLAYQNL
ncbi:protein maelstrom homolog [Antedon mediterranea]|uniref:protein maelstrom homolog n=1 Tax=Antedon mediterranea TaxID=105859 RepID=UPI003AF50214